MSLQASAARTSATISPFARDQFTVPAQNRVGRDDCRHLREQAPPKSLTEFAEPSALVVVETEALFAEARLENSIFLSQKRDQICLLTMKPPTYHRDQ
ncbi:MAG TPA: hypothetical protein VFS23_17910 [Vicinamibacterales bacterium]|nr:hypothetical protein [Vicinamibacterales bacterium]